MLAVLQELVFDALPEGAVWPFDRTYIRPRHFHGQLEALLVTRGAATVHLGTRAVSVHDGQLCWVLPGVPHVMSDFSADFDMWVVQLNSTAVERGWRHAAGAPQTEPGGNSSPFATWSLQLGELLSGRATVDLAGSDLQQMSDVAASVWTASDRAQASRHLGALCVLALRATLGSIDRRRALSVAELVSCLLLSSPTADRHAAAAELGVSEGFLSRSVHRDLGVTFVEHRARARVAHFLELVQQGESNLLSAALGAGFGSYSQFFRIFTRVSGSRPRDYLDAGRRRSALLVAGDQNHPDSGSVVRLPDEERQHAPL